MTLLGYVELCKPRIGMMIVLTALVGYAAVAEDLEWPTLLFLSLIMLLGSSSSSIFNHFYDRDLDQKMQRTAQRPW